MTRVTLHITPAPVSSGQRSARSCDDWISRILELDENDLHTLIPLLEVFRSTESLRKTIQLVPALMEPGRALQAHFSKPLDDFLTYAFMLHSLRDFIETRKEPMSLASWCWHMLETLANDNIDTKANLTEWCRECLLLSDPAYAEWHDSMASQARSTDLPANNGTL